MSKIIIHVKQGISDLQAINLVKSVVSGGLVSNNNNQYCYITTFTNNVVKTKIIVDCNKRGDTFTFKVFNDSN